MRVLSWINVNLTTEACPDCVVVDANPTHAVSVMVGHVPTIHVFAGRTPCSRRGCSPQGRA
ncbi:hypothetical protein BOSEA31B_14837 [Hyphomicrobiales bacterium]|nr:hypothetical protein BOSEA31B_14837 [Hyphomicrobiales bacterium]CAH1701327.1 hypothetical protein BOSEA1005_21026 [Hyphomicrobiales bacterium]CAI0345287.1 hypothetical protein BO1005MUT1_380082 [Hyphomicrobiales bacterium]